MDNQIPTEEVPNLSPQGNLAAENMPAIKKHTLLYIIIAISSFTVIVLLAVVVLGYFYPSTYFSKLSKNKFFLPMSSIFDRYYYNLIEKKKVSFIYEKYCSDKSVDVTTVTAKNNLEKLSFEEIKYKIKEEKDKSDIEQINFIYNDLVSFLDPNINLNTNMLGQYVLGFRDIHNLTKKQETFAKPFWEGESTELFIKLYKSGFTPYTIPTVIILYGDKVGPGENGRYHSVSPSDILMYNLWYSAVTNLPQEELKKPEYLSYINFLLVLYLEQVNHLLQDTEEAKSELVKVQINQMQQSKSLLLRGNIATLTHGDLIKDRDIGFSLYNLSVNLLSNNKDFEGAFKLQSCSAEKYYDTFSMNDLSTNYLYGTASSTVESKEKAYYWLMSLALTDSMQYGFFTDYKYVSGWNTLARIDAMQNTTQLPDESIREIEDRSQKFVQEKYPTLTANGLKFSSHSMNAFIDGFQKGEAEPKIPKENSFGGN